METITCGECGIEFSIPERKLAELRASGDTFYCPNGHARVFRPSQLESLKEKVEQLKLEVERQKVYRADSDARWRERYRLARRQTAAYKGHFTRLKRDMGRE